MKNNSSKIRKTGKLLFIVACVYTVFTLMSFFSTMHSYTVQGYPFFEVVKYLFPSQFLPTVVQPFALLAGLAYLIGCVADLSEQIESIPASVPRDSIRST